LALDDDRRFLAEMLRVAERLSGRDLQIAVLEGDGLSREARLDAALERLQRAAVVPPGTDRAQVERLTTVYAAGMRAFFAYAPRSRWDGPAFVLKAEDALGWGLDVERYRDRPGPALGWERLCPRLVARTAPGNHLTLCAGLNAAGAAAQIEAFLAGRLH
jgi:thioesterase domain-containing protein